MLEAEGARGVPRDHVHQRSQLAVPRHLAVVGEHERRLQWVAVAERIPRVHHGVVADADVDAGGQQLLHTRMPTPDRIAVEPALQRRVVERVGDHVHLGALQVVDQLVRIRVVVRVHRCRMACGYATAHTQADRLGGHHLHEARLIVIRLVAVDVDA